VFAGLFSYNLTIMQKLLSLDISSSTIGWSLFEISDKIINLVECDYIKPPSKAKAQKIGESFSYRLNFIFEAITDLIKKTKPDVVAVEDYAKKFSAGRSSANTIIVLATSNETVCLACYKELGKEPYRIPVTRLRSVVKKKHSVEVKDKEDAMALCKKLFPTFTTVDNRNGNTKKEYYDISDSIIVGLGYHILEENL